MVSEYKNVYGMIDLDDTIEELPIPEEIARDISLKSYLVMNGERVEAYYERVSTPLDKPAKVVQTNIVEKPTFLGKWEDKTDEYVEAHKKKKAKKKDASSEDRPAVDRAEELRRAEELLRQLQARFGGDNE